MKDWKKSVFFGKVVVIALVVLIGFSIIACNNGSGGGGGGTNTGGNNTGGNNTGSNTFSGTYKYVDEIGGYGETIITFTGSNFSLSFLGFVVMTGTFTVSGNKITCTVTWLIDEDSMEGVSLGDNMTFTIINSTTLEDDEGSTFTKIR